MPKIETEIFFPYSVENIHNMVADIEKYPEFLPNCSSLTVKKREKTAQKGSKNVEKEHILAEMGVKYGLYSEKFDSNVTVNHMFHEIDVSLSSGPLKSLTNHWKFVEHQNKQKIKGCMATFSIEIEMKSFPLRLALAAAFKIGVNEITKAFVTRANKLYSC